MEEIQVLCTNFPFILCQCYVCTGWDSKPSVEKQLLESYKNLKDIFQFPVVVETVISSVLAKLKEFVKHLRFSIKNSEEFH